MTRNPTRAAVERRFSLGWVVVSYFLVCGGLCPAIAGYALTGTRDVYAIGAALFVGAGLGGFLAGRASPHRSYLEPVVAALLVIMSLVAFVYATPLGRVVVDRHRDEIARAALELAAVGSVGGLLGALVGEATQPDEHAQRPLGWVILAVFISAGALFAAGTAAAIVLLGEAAQAALLRSWTGQLDPEQPLVSEDRIALAAAACGALASFLGGLVTQMGAPRRALLPAALGAALVIAGAVMAIGWAAGRAADLAVPAAFFGGLAAAIALVGALAAFLAGRASGRLSPGPVSDKKQP